MARPTIPIFRNDTPTLLFTIKKKDGTAFDLTTADEMRFSAKFDLDDLDADVKINRTCTIDSPATLGKCRITLTTTETNTGTTKQFPLIADLQGKFAASTVIFTFKQFDLIITEDVIQS